MNKQELAAVIAIDTGVTQVQAKAMIQAFEFNVSEALANGETVKLVGFGTFKTNHREAYVGKNPATGGDVNVPAHRRVSFIAGQGLKAAVN